MDMANPITHMNIAAPTPPVLLVILDGVEKIPEPMMRPMLQGVSHCDDEPKLHATGTLHQESSRKDTKMTTQSTCSVFLESKLSCFDGVILLLLIGGECSLSRYSLYLRVLGLDLRHGFLLSLVRGWDRRRHLENNV